MDKPRQLILTITDRCNHGCHMCYYHDSLNQGALVMSLEEYRLLSRSLGEIEHLYISGGEPFLRQDLPEILALFYENNGTRSVFIPTNGSLPNAVLRSVRRMLDELPGLGLSLMLSLEGREEEHDRIHEMKGAFRSVLKTVEELNWLRIERLRSGKASLGLTMNSVVSSENAREIIPLMEYVLKNASVDAHFFSPMRGSGAAATCVAPAADVFRALVAEAQPYFRHYAAKSGRSEAPQRERYDLWQRLLGGGGLPYQCQAGNYIGVIEPDGRVRLCELTPVVGNLREAGWDFDKVWKSAEADDMRKRIVNCFCTHACFMQASADYYARQERTV
jgi:MoaA/NifB/PqqE/SkfB family radical SAM enzyme